MCDVAPTSLSVPHLISRVWLSRINPVVVLFLLMAAVFWIHRLFRTAVRFYRYIIMTFVLPSMIIYLYH